MNQNIPFACANNATRGRWAILVTPLAAPQGRQFFQWWGFWAPVEVA